jgi:hypothetical protein
MKSVAAYWQIVKQYRFLTVVLWLHIIGLVAISIYMPFETRMLNGISLWVKPIKFFVSIILYLITLPGLLYLLPFSQRKKRRFANIISIAMLVEVGCITLQAARGQFSHYNISSAFNILVFNLMGIFIVVNTVYVALLFIAMLKVQKHQLQSVVVAFRYALFLMLFASIGGFLMIAYNHHSIGAPDSAAGLPFINWNRTGGDLRVMHFFGIHALQILPLLALLAANRHRLLTVHLPAVAFTSIVVLLFLQAMAGQAFLA